MHAIDAGPMTLDEPADAAVITLLADQLSRLPAPAAGTHRPHRYGVAIAIMTRPAVGLDEHLRTAAASCGLILRRSDPRDRPIFVDINVGLRPITFMRRSRPTTPISGSSDQQRRQRQNRTQSVWTVLPPSASSTASRTGPGGRSSKVNLPR